MLLFERLCLLAQSEVPGYWRAVKFSRRREGGEEICQERHDFQSILCMNHRHPQEHETMLLDGQQQPNPFN